MTSKSVRGVEASILRRLEEYEDQSEESEPTDQVGEVSEQLVESEEQSEQDDDSETFVGSSRMRHADSESDSEGSGSSSDWHGGHHHDEFGDGHVLSHDEHDHAGGRIGMAVGAGVVSVGFLALVGFALFCFLRRRRRAARSIKNADSKSNPESKSNSGITSVGIWVPVGAPLPEGYAYAKPPPELEGAMPGQMYALPEPATVTTGGVAPDVAVGIPVEEGEIAKDCVQGLGSSSFSSGAAAGENPTVACGV